MLEPGILVTIAIACIGAVVWAVRVEGRVNGHDESFLNLDKFMKERDDSLDKLLEERDERIKERHVDIAGRLARIETKIDRGFEKGTTS